MICRIIRGKEGVKFYKNDMLIQNDGSIKLISTGDNIILSDLEINSKNIIEKDILGEGCSGLVKLGNYTPLDIDLAIKSVNIYDKAKRNQVINDLKPYIISIKNNEKVNKNVITMYGVYTDKETLKLAMELMEFGSLRELIYIISLNKNKKVLIKEKWISIIIMNILNGLEFLHGHLNQIHRDIKPENILINSFGDIKISDFGVSKYLDLGTNYAKTFVGTMNYMSPERLLGDNYNYNCDIWSIGIIAFELFFGKLPFENKTSSIFNNLNFIIKSDFKQIIQNYECIYSNDFFDFLIKCLEKDPLKRPNVKDLLSHNFIKRYNNDYFNKEFKKWIIKKYYNYLKFS